MAESRCGFGSTDQSPTLRREHVREDHDLQWRRQQLSPEWKARLYRPGVRLSTDVSSGARFRELHEDPLKEADRGCGAASLLQMLGRDDCAVAQENRWDLKVIN